ncbi:type II toxin-antitoxin system RelE/ParE family toxin [Robertmurraya korlensis]|uniref:type II toxin-antitoxin system RelE/ParE family toxin n=1 Tax=Robertmurraya korlensis TaxID=519977 RepID=UPI00204060AB|nr:type II toxin-antitoxin system RelE/ParE family toxin [Robertmurraya korlensis]MCM3603192.1 type II toxin-antitoxin system RelE/ParE family toxin [Robertmurraya korlensis]
MEKILKQTEKKNKHLYSELIKKRQEIVNDPLIGTKLKGDLKEFRSLDFKFKGHELRICYAYYQEDNHVVFLYAGTRENFYDEVKRYVNR